MHTPHSSRQILRNSYAAGNRLFLRRAATARKRTTTICCMLRTVRNTPEYGSPALTRTHDPGVGLRSCAPELDSGAVAVSRSRSWTGLPIRPSRPPAFTPLIPSIHAGRSTTLSREYCVYAPAHRECAAWIRLATARAVSMGTAKPVWRSPLPVPATLIPMAWPDRFTRGPPVSSPATTWAVDTSRPVSRWPPAASTPVPLVRLPMSRVKVLSARVPRG